MHWSHEEVIGLIKDLSSTEVNLTIAEASAFPLPKGFSTLHPSGERVKYIAPPKLNDTQDADADSDLAAALIRLEAQAERAKADEAREAAAADASTTAEKAPGPNDERNLLSRAVAAFTNRWTGNSSAATASAVGKGNLVADCGPVSASSGTAEMEIAKAPDVSSGTQVQSTSVPGTPKMLNVQFASGSKWGMSADLQADPLRVTNVREGGQSAALGIVKGDCITAVDGMSVATNRNIAVALLRRGGAVAMTLSREESCQAGAQNQGLKNTKGTILKKKVSGSGFSFSKTVQSDEATSPQTKPKSDPDVARSTPVGTPDRMTSSKSDINAALVGFYKNLLTKLKTENGLTSAGRMLVRASEEAVMKIREQDLSGMMPSAAADRSDSPQREEPLPSVENLTPEQGSRRFLPTTPKSRSNEANERRGHPNHVVVSARKKLFGDVPSSPPRSTRNVHSSPKSKEPRQQPSDRLSPGNRPASRVSLKSSPPKTAWRLDGRVLPKSPKPANGGKSGRRFEAVEVMACSRASLDQLSNEIGSNTASSINPSEAKEHTPERDSTANVQPKVINNVGIDQPWGLRRSLSFGDTHSLHYKVLDRGCDEDSAQDLRRSTSFASDPSVESGLVGLLGGVDLVENQFRNLNDYETSTEETPWVSSTRHGPSNYEAFSSKV